MDYRAFYARLFAPLEERLGPLDPDTLMAIIGFDEGGPLNLCTIGRGGDVVTYVSCELAVREDQVPNASGRYELLVSGNDEDWIRQVITDTGDMSLRTAFNDGDTLDIGAWVNDDDGSDASLQGLLFRQEVIVDIDGAPYGVLRAIGITRTEMELAREQGADALVARLQAADVYPHTLRGRAAVA
jgi:hypothetical protein